MEEQDSGLIVRWQIVSIDLAHIDTRSKLR